MYCIHWSKPAFDKCKDNKQTMKTKGLKKMKREIYLNTELHSIPWRVAW